MYPQIHLGPVTLQTFGLCFALAFLAAGALIGKRFGGDRQAASTGAMRWASRRWLGGIVGSRVYFLVQNYSKVKHDLIGNLFCGSGLVWYGGAIGGALAVIAWAC